ncbi:hypothetical protein B2G71_20110 [Novosphingobium sp. PC22D]|uniref:thermonuclease family protein n=1 Tax=Novosphingobium sp. PC22D TaxID=1962403 RepID=UPI000BF0E6BB|nr:hypothetical protein [Novosphingobium sp. PC22D]PEQ10781.1 hypothetical protein B2G71_20110 [Novosphingobium sp. PC22D]
MMFTFLVAVAVIQEGQVFTCTPIRVWDGDGPIWCAEGPHVRLSGIAAREIDGACRDYQPCPRASAEAARDALVAILGGPRGRAETGHVLVNGPRLRCVSTGPAKGNRTGAWCTLPGGQDLSCMMVRSGTVLKWRRFWGQHRCGK